MAGVKRFNFTYMLDKEYALQRRAKTPEVSGEAR